MEGGGRGEEGWKGEGGERRDGRGRVGKEGKQWKEGGQTHLGSSSPVSVHFVFVRARSSSFVGGRVCPRSRAVVLVRARSSSFMGGFMSWAFVIRAWGSSSSVLSFVGAASSCVGGGARSRAVYVVRGWGVDGRGLWLSYTRGVRVVVGH